VQMEGLLALVGFQDEKTASAPALTTALQWRIHWASVLVRFLHLGRGASEQKGVVGALRTSARCAERSW